MKKIVLDASGWRSKNDFFDALLPALGAPGWHGANLDALEETLLTNEDNAVRAPFSITIQNSASVPPALRDCFGTLAEIVADARRDRGLDILLVLD